MNTKRFFTFNQNNSGGSFDYSLESGITHHVVIEADSAHDANVIAIMKGLYFDGCDNGQDCSCCGDRWDRVGQYGDAKGDEVPMIYGKPASAADGLMAWMEPGREIAVHFADGRIEWHGVATKVQA